MRAEGAPLTTGSALLQAILLAAVVAGTKHLPQLLDRRDSWELLKADWRESRPIYAPVCLYCNSLRCKKGMECQMGACPIHTQSSWSPHPHDPNNQFLSVGQ
eukprot:4685116-Amphidinium_carterae.1